MRSLILAAIAMLEGAVTSGLGAESSTGSGVVINTKGELLTNSHVVEACRTITARPEIQKRGVLAARDERNLAGANNPPTSAAMFREGPPVRAGDTIVALGYPLSGVLATDATFQSAT